MMMKKIHARWIGWIIAFPFLLFLLLSFLVFLPPVQQFLVDKAAVYASEESGLEISVDKISLSFPLDLVVNDVLASEEQDTLLHVEELKVEIQLLPLFHKRIEVDGVWLKGVKVKSGEWIPGMRLEGNIGTFFLASHGVAFDPHTAMITQVLLEETNLDVTLFPQADEDTTVSEPLYWKIYLQSLQTKNVSMALHLPADSMNVSASLGNASMHDGWLNLHDVSCFLDSFEIEEGAVSYHQGNHVEENLTAKASASLDASHLDFQDLHLNLDSIYYCGRDMRGKLSRFSFRERSGLSLLEGNATILSDSQRIYIPRLSLKTPYSSAAMETIVDWSVLDSLHQGYLDAKIDLKVGKKDMCNLLALRGKKEETFYPEKPFTFHFKTQGNLDELQVKQCLLSWPDVMQLDMVGSLKHLTDSLRRGGAFRMEAVAGDLPYLSSWQPQWGVSSGTRLEGLFSASGSKAMVDLLLKQPEAKAVSAVDVQVQHVDNDSLSLPDDFKMKHAARLLARYDGKLNAYSADLVMNELDMHQFMPQDSLYEVTLGIKVEGKGTDFFARNTQIDASARIDRVHYASYHLSGYDFSTQLKNHHLDASWTADNAAMELQGRLKGLLKANNVEMNLQLDAPKLDWMVMGLSPEKLSTQHQLNLALKSNLKNNHQLKVALLNTSVKTEKESFKTKDLFVDFTTRQDSTAMQVRSGDLDARLYSKVDVEKALVHCNRFVSLLDKQWKSKTIVQNQLKENLPDLSLSIRSGRDNLLARALKLKNISYNDMNLNLRTSPEQGINGSSYLRGLKMDSLALDTIYVDLKQDSLGVNLVSGVKNGKNLQQEPFEAIVSGYLREGKAQALLQYLNEKKERGIHLGVNAELHHRGIRLKLMPDQPTLAYRPFSLNDDNYVFLEDKGRLYANVRLYEANGTGFSLYSSQTDTVARQDMTLELQKVNLQEFKRVLPYLPDVRGLLSGTAHYVDAQDQTQMSAELQLREFTYEGSNLGTWEMNGVYLPDDENNHLVDGFVLHDGEEIIQLSGKYHDGDEQKNLPQSMKVDINLADFPLYIVNPFVPDQMVEMGGSVSGELKMDGSTSRPVLNGNLALNDVSMALPDLSVKFLFDKKQLQMKDSRLLFDNYHIYTKGKSPFKINGNVDFLDTDHLMVDLKLKADDYELMNAPKTRRAMAYGKIYVDVDASLSGPVDEMKMRGNMNLLGKTDFTYVLKESPLAVNDRLSDMVTFVNFNDTTTVEAKEEKVSLTGMDIAMTIHIDEAVQARVDLTPDGSNYMQLEGGGDLAFQYTPQGEMLLNGRYSFMSGELEYQIPVIPLKIFAIKNGSYMNWTGNPMNPELNIKATERVRALVGDKDQTPRMVGFDVGLKLTNQLENLGLAFTLETPEDATVQEELQAMSEEERGKLAITMLVTGMYMAEGNATGGFNMNNAFNSFLQQQISDIVGQSVDISVGMETMDNVEAGGKQTDYNFQFAKRFWNNRFRVVIGGSVSTGNTAQRDETFIDNISVEYRLDTSGSRYVKLFHDKNYESVLEGEVVETGIGVVLRKKVSNLSELFIFRRKRNEE